jgi:hypothetical protein
MPSALHLWNKNVTSKQMFKTNFPQTIKICRKMVGRIQKRLSPWKNIKNTFSAQTPI